MISGFRKPTRLSYTISAVLSVVFLAPLSSSILYTQVVTSGLAERIEITPDRIDFGETIYNDGNKELKAEVVIANPLAVPVVVKNIKASCICAISQKGEITIAPNGKEVIEIGLNLSGIMGERVAKVALIFSDDSAIIIPLRVYVNNVIFAQPDNIVSSFFAGSDNKEISALLSRYIGADDKRAGNMTVVCQDQKTNALTQVKVIELDRSQSNSTKARNMKVFKVNASAANLELGSQSGKIRCVFDDGLEFTIPYLIDITRDIYIARKDQAVAITKTDGEYKGVVHITKRPGLFAKVKSVMIKETRMKSFDVATPTNPGTRMVIEFTIENSLAEALKRNGNVTGEVILQVENSRNISMPITVIFL